MMKRFLYLLTMFFTLNSVSYAQDDEGGEKIHERMTEYLQKRLKLSKSEADRFGPVFLQYFHELKKTNHEYKGDGLVLQQKIADLRLRYREQFKGIMGEKRSNDVFKYERDFVNEVKQLRQERMQNQKGKPNKKT